MLLTIAVNGRPARNAAQRGWLALRDLANVKLRRTYWERNPLWHAGLAVVPSRTQTWVDAAKPERLALAPTVEVEGVERREKG